MGGWRCFLSHEGRTGVLKPRSLYGCKGGGNSGSRRDEYQDRRVLTNLAKAFTWAGEGKRKGGGAFGVCQGRGELRKVIVGLSVHAEVRTTEQGI